MSVCVLSAIYLFMCIYISTMNLCLWPSVFAGIYINQPQLYNHRQTTHRHPVTMKCSVGKHCPLSFMWILLWLTTDPNASRLNTTPHGSTTPPGFWPGLQPQMPVKHTWDTINGTELPPCKNQRKRSLIHFVRCQSYFGGFWYNIKWGHGSVVGASIQ